MAQDFSNFSDFLKKLVQKPGVYLMFNADNQVIYVGKAKNLKKRVSSYFNREHGENKTQKLVSQIDHIEVTVTPSESEALILENTLIKEYRPRYNILFRDDKTYPYLYLTPAEFPQLQTYRGMIKKKGLSFGPYPNVSSTREMQKIIQKIFKLRDCTDLVFANRARPCLQYQMGRCSAPCVGLISQQDYQQQIKWAQLFLEGKNQTVLKALGDQMQEASDQLDFEKAAKLRDQIALLNKLQKDQSVYTQLKINADVLGYAREEDRIFISVISIRHGQVLGSHSVNQKIPLGWEFSSEEILEKFIEQIYTLSDPPKKIDELISPMQKNIRGVKKQWLEMARNNAEAQRQMYRSEHEQTHQRFERLEAVLNLSFKLNRMECVDISHHQGEATVASCVVFTPEGPQKAAYRKFNIEDIQAGDDYAAIYQVVFRRFKKLLEEGMDFPELFLIDGGPQQLKKAQEALLALGIEGVFLLAVSKGPERKVGLEQLWKIGSSEPLHLKPDDPALHLIQHIRDESHRFAIEGHRAKKAKKRSQSKLEELPGIGPKRRRALLSHFGSLDQVLNASVEELCKVEGISRSLALKILS